MDMVDARGLPCPEPVVMTKKALEKIEAGKLTVLLDNLTSLQNVQRFVKTQGHSFEVKIDGSVFQVEITKKARQDDQAEKMSRTVIVITSDELGSGDPDLGQLLITSFINTLPESENRPAKMLFINRGVLLTTEGSRVLDTLQHLEGEGVEIFSCGTCLNHYGLKEKLKAGQVTNMYDTVESLMSAEKVIRL